MVTREGKLSTHLIDDTVFLKLGQHFLQRLILFKESLVLEEETTGLGEEPSLLFIDDGILDWEPRRRTHIDDVVRAGKVITCDTAVWTGIMHVCSWSILGCRWIVYNADLQGLGDGE
jgi:hypothetical protein